MNDVVSLQKYKFDKNPVVWTLEVVEYGDKIVYTVCDIGDSLDDKKAMLHSLSLFCEKIKKEIDGAE